MEHNLESKQSEQLQVSGSNLYSRPLKGSMILFLCFLFIPPAKAPPTYGVHLQENKPILL